MRQTASQFDLFLKSGRRQATEYPHEGFGLSKDQFVVMPAQDAASWAHIFVCSTKQNQTNHGLSDMGGTATRAISARSCLTNLARTLQSHLGSPRNANRYLFQLVVACQSQVTLLFFADGQNQKTKGPIVDPWNYLSTWLVVSHRPCDRVRSFRSEHQTAVKPRSMCESKATSEMMRRA